MPKTAHTLEITSADSGGITGSTFDQLVAHPEPAPKLKAMQFTSNSDRAFMKSMKALTKARVRMKITLQIQSRRKKWGDWGVGDIIQRIRRGENLLSARTWKN